MRDFDLEDFRIRDRTILSAGAPASRKPKRRRRTTGLGYLAGPIPTSWLNAAGQLPGKALHVGLAVWMASRVTKTNRFKLGRKWYAGYDVGPRALRTALRRLQGAGLIRLEKRPGSLPIVTLLRGDDDNHHTREANK